MQPSILFDIVPKLHSGLTPAKPINGKPPRYSASTIKQFMQCPRKHFFEQVVGLETSPSDALVMGTAVHAAVEKWLLQGVMPNAMDRAGRVALGGLKHLPPPGTKGMHVEHVFNMASWPGGPAFTGTVDLFLEPENEGDNVKLKDHKTTSAYKWALTKQTLPEDAQCIAYSTFLLRKFPEAPAVDAEWIYYNKKDASSLPVPVVMERKETLGKWRERLLPVLEEMQNQHKERPALKVVQANESECSAYGGCPHRSYCVNYSHAPKGEGSMGRLSQQIMKEHAALKDDGGDDAPQALNPPPVQAPQPRLVSPLPSLPSSTPAVNPFATMPPAQATVAQAPGASEAAPVAEKPKATRVKKSEAATRDDATNEKPAAAGAGFSLFVGCYPLKGSKKPMVHCDDLLAPLASEVAKAAGVPHYGLVEFAQGPKQLAAALYRFLENNPTELDGKNVYIPSIGPAADAALSVLVPKAAVVIQKVV
jgi:hypothetical protein